MGKTIILTIAALILAATVITLLIWLAHVVVAFFSAERAELRKARHDAEDATDDLERAIKRNRRRGK